MARFSADPTKDTAGFPILPKADYRLRIGEPKAFLGETKEGENKGRANFGVGIPLTVVPGPVDLDGNTSPEDSIGKKAYNRLFYHTQESRNFSKTFILAAFGYTQREEEEFNSILAKLKAEDPNNPAVDWDFDYETGEVGRAWKSMTNIEVVASLSIGKNNKGADQQQWDQVRPAPSRATTAQESEINTDTMPAGVAGD